MIEIIPAIDIIDGKCVRLCQGRYDMVSTYSSSPEDMVMRYADCGVSRVHLVDLDGAKQSQPCNLKTLEKLANRDAVKLEWGGGVKSSAALKSVFDAGADFAIAGSSAALQPELFREWIRIYGGDRMILGADLKDGIVAVKGWLEGSGLNVDELVDRFTSDGLTQVICTDISRDGMLQGPADSLYVRLQKKYPDIDFTVSGGISAIDDILRLNNLGLRKVIVGKAIYEHRISLDDIKRLCLQKG